MAERRMISKKIVDTDLFLDMPATSRLLYYDLLIRADDDGFVGSPKKITKMVGASDDDMRILTAKGFIIPFESGVCVIKDWRIHNYIKNDRYQPTQYLAEKSQLQLSDNKSYEISGSEMEPECIQSGTEMDTQDRIGKVSIGEYRENREKTPVSPATSQFDYEAYRNVFIECCPSLPAPKAVGGWTPARKKSVRAKKITPEEFRDVCKKIERSDFLSGRDGKWHGCSFDWILKPANWQKINEGNYDNRSEHPKGFDRDYTFDLDEYERESVYDAGKPVDK